MKKIISVILAVSVLCCFMVSVNASQIQPRYSYTTTYTTGIHITDSGKATCTANVTGITSTTKIEITMSLQKKVLFWWDDIETWTLTEYDLCAAIGGTVENVSSGTYRTKAVYTVYCGSDSETITGYSQETKY